MPSILGSTSIRTGLFALFLTLIAATGWAQTSLYEDPRAHREGDILTVVLAEETVAERSTRWQRRSSAGRNASAEVSAGSQAGGTFAADATVDSDIRGRRNALQSDLLEGTITTRVAEVDEYGILHVEGERNLHINGETYLLQLRGEVRPYDVSFNNTVLSFQLANAHITYRETGLGRDRFGPGFFARVGTGLAIGVAAILLVLK